MSIIEQLVDEIEAKERSEEMFFSTYFIPDHYKEDSLNDRTNFYA